MVEWTRDEAEALAFSTARTRQRDRTDLSLADALAEVLAEQPQLYALSLGPRTDAPVAHRKTEQRPMSNAEQTAYEEAEKIARSQGLTFAEGLDIALSLRPELYTEAL